MVAREPLYTVADELQAGEIVDRSNRFVVRVRFNGEPERAFLGDPGALEGIVEPGRTILCNAVNDPERATDYDAIAVQHEDIYVSVRAALANDLFERVLEREAVSSFSGYSIQRREPPLPEHGRTDFLLVSPTGADVYVEVKSCTYAENGVAKFPDRPTKRGRRHLASLRSLFEKGIETHVVFVVQRPDIERFRPYREVDPEFASLLTEIAETGVGVHAVVAEFDPPHYWLRDTDLPIELIR